MLLVTGCGRSGTHYTSELLKRLGLDVPHERVGRDGAASWKHIVSGTFVYVGKHREVEIDSRGFTRVLHQVRHPLKVISSMQTFSASTWQFMAKFIELDLTAPPVRRAMQAWVGWNLLIEPRARWRFQIEQLAAQFDRFCTEAGVPVQPLPEVPHAAKDSRTDRFAAVCWEDMRALDARGAEAVRELAMRYGYGDLAVEPPPATRAPARRSLLARLLRRPN